MEIACWILWNCWVSVLIVFEKTFHYFMSDLIFSFEACMISWFPVFIHMPHQFKLTKKCAHQQVLENIWKQHNYQPINYCCILLVRFIFQVVSSLQSLFHLALLIIPPCLPPESGLIVMANFFDYLFCAPEEGIVQ